MVQNSEKVRESVQKILSDSKIRKNCLKILAANIKHADEAGSHKWCTHLKSNKIRLLVGSIIACTIQENEIWIPLDQKSLEEYQEIKELLNSSEYWRWDTEEYPEYKKVPSKNGYYRPNDDLKIWDKIRPLHFQFIQKVAYKFDHLLTSSQKNHEPTLLEYIDNELDQTLPKPDIDFPINQITSIQDIFEAHKEILELNIPTTEKQSLINSRIGQGRFRTNLKIYWNNKCAVTVSFPDFHQI